MTTHVPKIPKPSMDSLKCSVIVASLPNQGRVNMHNKCKTVITLVDTLTWTVKKYIFNHIRTIKINWFRGHLEGGINMRIPVGL